jgi:starch phosphorylase
MEKHQLSFSEARAAASASLVFTTHTPVQAGHDYFPPQLMDHYFGQYFPRLGITWAEFLGLGRRNPFDDREEFCMTVLAPAWRPTATASAGFTAKSASGVWQSMAGLAKEILITRHQRVTSVDPA